MIIRGLLALALLGGAAQAQEGWIARDGAELQALDKVNARTAKLEVRTGEAVEYGTLTITLRGCRVRSEDQAAEAVAWLEIRDSRAASGVVPVFQGWMFATAPSVSMLEHPVYDIRVLRCR